MKRIGIALLTALVVAVASAQTRWEYAMFQVSTFLDRYPVYQYRYQDDTRHADTGTWREFTQQTGIQTVPGGYWAVLSQLGRERFELVSHSIATGTYDGAFIMNAHYEIQIWYFKRPLPSP